MTLSPEEQEEYDKETDRRSRKKIIRMSLCFLEDFLYGKLQNRHNTRVTSDLPEGIEIIGVYYDKRLASGEETVEIFILHPDFEPVPRGEKAPDLKVTFQEVVI